MSCSYFLLPQNGFSVTKSAPFEDNVMFSFVLVSREGRAGGYKEFDEAEIEETRRRRKELEEVVGDTQILSSVIVCASAV